MYVGELFALTALKRMGRKLETTIVAAKMMDYEIIRDEAKYSYSIVFNKRNSREYIRVSYLHDSSSYLLIWHVDNRDHSEHFFKIEKLEEKLKELL